MATAIKNRDWKVLGDYLKELGFIDQNDQVNAYKAQLGAHKHRDDGEHRPFGTFFSTRLTGPQIMQGVEMQEKDRLKHLDPISQFSPSTKFGARLLDYVCDKKRLARIAAELFVEPNKTVFIADGTSGFYTFLSIARDIAPKGIVTVRTNSLAILMEYSQSAEVAKNIEIEVVGDVPAKATSRNEYLALIGKNDNEEDVIRKACRHNVVFLPVTGLTYEHGPFARDRYIRNVKRWIMESAARTIFVADFSKLCRTPSELHADHQQRVYEDEDEWKLWRAKRPWHLITSIHPKDKSSVASGDIDTLGPSQRQTDLSCEAAVNYHNQAQAFFVDRNSVPNGFVEVASFYDS